MIFPPFYLDLTEPVHLQAEPPKACCCDPLRWKISDFSVLNHLQHFNLSRNGKDDLTIGIWYLKCWVYGGSTLFLSRNGEAFLVDPPYTQHFMEIHVLTPLWGFPADQAPGGVQPNGPAATEACEASSSGHAAWEDAGAG
jgi:hypothetical protein